MDEFDFERMDKEMNEKYNKTPSQDEVIEFAAQLGADKVLSDPMDMDILNAVSEFFGQTIPYHTARGRLVVATHDWAWVKVDKKTRDEAVEYAIEKAKGSTWYESN